MAPKSTILTTWAAWPRNVQNGFQIVLSRLRPISHRKLHPISHRRVEWLLAYFQIGCLLLTLQMHPTEASRRITPIRNSLGITPTGPMGPCPGGPKGPLPPLGPWDPGPFLGSWVPSPGSQGVSIRMALASTEREYLGACKYGACKRVGGHARSVKNQCKNLHRKNTKFREKSTKNRSKMRSTIYENSVQFRNLRILVFDEESNVKMRFS